MHLEYDPAKNAANRRKHGVDLEDAKVVLFDPRALVREDRDSEAEQGFVAVGLDALGPGPYGCLCLPGTGQAPVDIGPSFDQQRATSL